MWRVNVMSKWKSETFNLESKSQLKAHRQHRLGGWCLDNDLERLNYFSWTPEEKALEMTFWEEVDNRYEARKAELREKLNALSPTELTTYFNEIGVEQIPIEDYLPESPV